ncbi:hypothetical protein FB45DRAFT_1021392 [Roridomyces roridus]|uniref:Uncharacterized protein n=1 Tax=Roridomyces roridus TaxID=1738132 RepID=A0AAD7CBW7_9AGAR|nr:hypothetical protein FB45DRAFT_1021392 [Roridomyces roridus]
MPPASLLVVIASIPVLLWTALDNVSYATPLVAVPVGFVLTREALEGMNSLPNARVQRLQLDAMLITASRMGSPTLSTLSLFPPSAIPASQSTRHRFRCQQLALPVPQLQASIQIRCRVYIIPSYSTYTIAPTLAKTAAPLSTSPSPSMPPPSPAEHVLFSAPSHRS